MAVCCDLPMDGQNDPDRRDFFRLLASGAASASVAGIGQPALAAGKEIRIGYLPIADASLLLVAHANGFFADHGLNVAKPRLFRSWKQLVEAFRSGEINLAHMLNPIPVWLRFNNDFPIKIIGWGHVNGSAVLVSPSSGVSEFGQLAGKRVAIPSPYSVHNVIIQRQIRAAGLTPIVIPADQPVPAGQVGLSVLPPPDMVRALADGRVAGFTVAEPFNSMGESIAKGNILRFTGDVWKNHPCCVIVMNQSDVEFYPDATQKIAEAFVDAAFFAMEDRERLALLLSREGKGYLPMPWTIIHKALTNYVGNDAYIKAGALRNQSWGVGRIDFNPYPYHSATKTLISYMAETSISGTETFSMPMDAETAAQDLVDDRFMKRALSARPDWVALLGADPNAPFERTETIDL